MSEGIPCRQCGRIFMTMTDWAEHVFKCEGALRDFINPRAGIFDGFSGSAGETCENCRFARMATTKTSFFIGKMPIGVCGPYDEWTCHLKPPDKHDNYDEWPLVRPDDFCGEFRRRAEVEDAG